MANKIPGVLINFNIYINNSIVPAVGTVTLPTIATASVEQGGAGIAGTVSMPILGQFQSMELSIEWKSITSKAAELSAPGVHSLELRGVQQGVGDNGLQLEKWAIWASVMFKSWTPGTAAPAASTGGSHVFEVLALSIYENDKPVLKIDKKSQVYATADAAGKMVDHLATIREMT